MDQIKNWLPIGSIAVIVFSFLNLHFYFTQFGVVIHHYIDVSEIIFSLTVFFASFLFLLIATTWYFLFVEHKKQTSENANEETNTYKYLKFHRIKFLRKFAGVFSKMTLYVFFATIAIGFYIFYLNTQYSDKDLMESSIYYDFVGFMFLCSLSGYIVLCSLWYRKKTELDNKGLYLFLCVFLINVIVFSAIRNARSADLIKKGFPKYSLHLKTNDNRTYATNHSILYVGATKNFYFLYDKKIEDCTIIPSSTVIEAKVSRLRGGL